MIRINRHVCADLSAAQNLEWLETNGLGGFASSTIAGLNTRRYHGLLIAATQPPVGRLTMLSKLEETVVIGDRRYELSTNQYPGTIYPRGFEFLAEFRLDPFPISVYEIEDVRIEKAVFMIQGENSTVIQYSIHTANGVIPSDLSLELRPLLACRDYHGTTHENATLDANLEIEQGLVSIKPYNDLPRLSFAYNHGTVGPAGMWYRRVQYQMERERGLDFEEDLFNPFVLRFDVPGEIAIVASTEPIDGNASARAADYRLAEIERRSRVLAQLPSDNELVQQLLIAADQFIVARGEEKSIIAGYHWFSDWGRDTMIALPGLTLATRRYDVAKSILLAFAKVVDRGMLPNRFPDAGQEPEYNTVDATLWYLEAVRTFLQQTNEVEFVRALYPVLTDIIEWHERGTRYGIRVDGDGLLQGGEPGVQLTWMDAKVGDWVVTPRIGKPVEIQALWYNALMIMTDLASRFGDNGGEKRYGRMSRLAKDAFNDLFWNKEADCLYDVIDGDARDESIRPNQIFAVSLHHSMLSRDKGKRLISVVERELLTRYGLRSLSPADPKYRGRYSGSPLERDGAYHQGTVWAWLIGPFVTAYLKVNGRNRKTLRQAEEWLEGFEAHLSDAGLG
ncbi:MAG: amylo-alpha-1,6-glucosidase, partial [Acidobacteriota bacterium]